MSNLKRYYVGPGEFGGCIEEECSDGVWVKFDDIKELLNTAHNISVMPCGETPVLERVCLTCIRNLNCPVSLCIRTA